MGAELLSESIRQKYEVREWKHACAILATDFPEEWNDIIALHYLTNFSLDEKKELERLLQARTRC